MLSIPAHLAGWDIVLCTPPRKDGSADPAVLLAAQQAPGVRVFKLGGAQAIAAMNWAPQWYLRQTIRPRQCVGG